MKRFVFIVVAIVLSFGSARAVDDNRFVIGMALTQTGANGRAGQDQLRGLQLWAEEVNARGGLLGRNVAIVHYDDTGDVQANTRLYEKLVTEDQAAMLVGPYSTESTLAAAAVAEKHGVPMIVPGPVSKSAWGRGYKHVTALYTAADTSMDHVLALAHSKGLRRVAVVYQNTVFPREIADSIKTKLAPLGLRLVLEHEYDKDSDDFSAVLGKLKSKRPDILLVGSYLPDAVAFVRQAKEHKFSARIMAFAAGPNAAEFGKTLGVDAEGILGGTSWEVSPKIAGTAEFARRYQAKYRHEPSYQAAGGYAAGQALESAARRAAMVEPERLRKALFDVDTPTVLGRYKVNTTGWQVGRAGHMVQWINRERVVVLPAEVASGEIVYPLKPWNKR